MDLNKLVKDFREKQVKLIEESGLPPIILEMILKDYYSQVHEIVLQLQSQPQEETEDGEH